MRQNSTIASTNVDFVSVESKFPMPFVPLDIELKRGYLVSMDLITNELKLNYLNRRTLEFAQLRSLAKSPGSEMYTLAEKVGHQIRGNAQTFELDQLTTSAVELQNAALEKSRDKIMTAVSKLEEKVTQALTALS